jgi:GNAT superfamily N-acetyltransferase
MKHHRIEGRAELEGDTAQVRVSARLEAHYQAADFDAGAGLIRVYRVALATPSGDPITSTSLTVADSDPGTGYVSDLSTLPAHRRKGYASRLYRELLPVARQLGITTLLSDTSRKPATTAIWRGLGATEYDAPHGRVYRLELG